LRLDNRPQAVPHDRVVIHAKNANSIYLFHWSTIAKITTD